MVHIKTIWMLSVEKSVGLKNSDVSLAFLHGFPVG